MISDNQITLTRPGRIEPETTSFASRGSGVQIPSAPPRGLHVSVGPIFTFGSDIPPVGSPWSGAGVFGAAAGPGLLVCPVSGHAFAWLRLLCCGGGGRWARGRGGSGRPGGEAGEGLAAPFAGFRGQPGGCAALVFFLPGVPGVQDALVAEDEQGRDEQHQGCQAHEAAPAAGDVAGGGVLDGGEAAFGAGAAGVGAAPGRRRVVVFLRG